MTDFIYFMIQSSLLIILVFVIRKAGKNYISARAGYCLWLIPMVRLLFPFVFVSVMLPSSLSSVHPYAMVQEAAASSEGVAGATAETGKEVELSAGSPGKDQEYSGRGTAVLSDEARQTRPKLLAVVIWAVGSLVTGSIFLYKNIRFFKWLKNGQKEVELPESFAKGLQKGGRLPKVYYRKKLASPCLAGIVHPAIFLNEKAVQSPETLKMVLLHEQMHYRQRDHIWNLCRNLVCIVYWFHPFVWWGAVASVQDAELACDERVVKEMRKEERRSYGAVLLDLLDESGKRTKPLDATTAMTGGKKKIEDRIRGIVKRRRTKKSVLTAGIILLLAVGAVGCTRAQADAGLSGDGMLPQEQTSAAGAGNTADEENETETASAELEKAEDQALSEESGLTQQDEGLPGWNDAYPVEPEPVRDLGGMEGQWRKVISCVDDNGDKIENPYEYLSWFEKTDGSKRLAVRSFDELICSWGDLLFYRYDRTIYVTGSDAINPFFSLPEGDGSIELYTAGKELGAYQHGTGNVGTLTFYDSRFNIVKQYSHVRLEEFSESYYCLMDLDTGLCGYVDDSGELVIPFSYSLAKGFHNGYAAVLAGAEAEVYYEDHTDKMFNQIGGFWGIIDKKGNYVIEPDEKYSNSFDRADLEGTTAHYINGPVGFAEVREDKTVDFIRWEDGKVLYTETIPD